MKWSDIVMCILCGEFIEQIHWTDMERRQLDTVVSGQFQRERKRSRLLRTKICNDLLSSHGITLKEWNNSKFIMMNNKGKMAVIHDLGQIWKQAKEMAGQPIDPLDDTLLQKLK
ncbi:hypothetical protein [Lentibacillus juripiscarius]|uniref:Uncharacterized protein n=1 Tax=Lentibacillus juripiscarius TaxID=257446 RepID=A0ABW5V5D3_9BACI